MAEIFDIALRSRNAHGTRRRSTVVVPTILSSGVTIESRFRPLTRGPS